MIEVEIIIEGDHDEIFRAQWEAIPGVGERFSQGGKDYIVADRGWGVCWSGNSSIWNKQCASIVLTEIPKES